MDAIASPPTTTAGGQPILPPGFRFHPTDEELMVHYLKKKATSSPLPVPIIADIDLYKFDPWELPGKASFGEHEWYFFSPRDRKYPNGARPNRAAASGYWKATGTDKPITSSSSHGQKLGVKKALVFYRGRPPKGVKTNWIMHEYRLTGEEHWPSCRPAFAFTAAHRSLRLDDWVLCRIYKKSAQASGAVEAREAVRQNDEQSSSCVEEVQTLAPLPKVGSFGFFAQDSDRFLDSILSDPESASSRHSDSNQQQHLLHGDGASVLGPDRAYPLMYSRFSTLPCALTTAFPKAECVEHVFVEPAAKGCPLNLCCSSDHDAFSMKGSLFSLPSLTHQRSPLQQQHKPLPQPSSDDLEAFWRCPLVTRAN